MDDLLSQLRGTQDQSGNKGDGIVEDVIIGNKTLDYEVLQDPFVAVECDALEMQSDETQHNDPTSSQIQTDLHIMKLDFGMLREIKEENGTETDVAGIRKDKGYRIEVVFATIVKSLDRFSKDVARLELVDESGTMSGSCLLKVVDEFCIKVGSVLVLNGCSLWKIGDNHLNITAANIKQIV